jgi:hypothetical protein
MRQPASQYPEDPYEERTREYELAADEAEERPLRPGRRLPAILLTLAVMALFVGGLWFAYVQGTRHGAGSAQNGVPVIRADDRPTKVKPEDPGGMPVPDQNVLLYGDRLGKATTEKLLPPPEQPMPRPAPPAPPPAKTTAVAPAAPAPAPGPEPAAPSPDSAPDRTAAPAAEPKPTVAPKRATSSPQPGGGAAQVRVGSVRTPDAARTEWQRLKHQNADLLGNLKANAIRVDLGEKGIYYRIVAGPLADAQAAERLCDELKRRNHGCVLAR